MDHAAAFSKIRFRDPQIEMAHGAGGKASRRLVEDLFAPLLLGLLSAPLSDAAHVEIDGARVAMTTDSFVVKPLRFPGGSIGELAVNGTVNDLAVSGARAQALVVTYVLEAGLPTEMLEAEVRAMADAASARRSGHRRRRHQGGRARQGRPHVHHHRRHRPPDSRRAHFARFGPPRRQNAALAGPSATTASPSCWRAATSISKPICRSDTRRVLPLVEALAARCGAGDSLDARSHSRRRRHISQRTGPRLRACGGALRRRDSHPRCGAWRVRAARAGPAAHRQ